MNTLYKGKKCIVTGGAGFIGQNIVNALVLKGADIFVVDRINDRNKLKRINSKAKVIDCDVRDPKLDKKLPKQHYDYLFHFAAPSSTVLFNENLAECIDVTIGGFLNTIRFASQHNIRYIYPSTGSLYNGVVPPHCESSHLKWDAQNEYAKAKITLEQIANTYKRVTSTLGLRISAGYGPGEKHKGRIQSVVYNFCTTMKKSVAPVVWGDGTQRRDFVFIDDIVAITLALAPHCPEPIVNIGTGIDNSFIDVIDIINTHLDSNITPTYVAKPRLYLEKTCADTTLLRKYYKGKFTPLTKGIQKTLKSRI